MRRGALFLAELADRPADVEVLDNRVLEVAGSDALLEEDVELAEGAAPLLQGRRKKAHTKQRKQVPA